MNMWVRGRIKELNSAVILYTFNRLGILTDRLKIKTRFLLVREYRLLFL